MFQAKDLVDSFQKIWNQTHVLHDALIELGNEHPKWNGWIIEVEDSAKWSAQEQVTTQHPFHAAASLVITLTHRHSGDGRDTWQMPGLLCVPQSLFPLIQEINDEKNNFTACIRAIRESSQGQPLSVTQSGQIVHDILAHAGFERVHIRHCTRHLTLLPEAPRFINLSWVRGRRSIQKISFDDCERELSKLARDAEMPHLKLQLENLYQLTPTERLRLRKVQLVDKHSVKGKIFWENGEEQDLGYLSLPAFVPAKKGTTHQLPNHTALSPQPLDKPRKKRSDARLPDSAFLPSIRVFLQNAG
ncbi:MAG: hypothetical protein V4629_11705 [Pseudomonadota bacterium]